MIPSVKVCIAFLVDAAGCSRGVSDGHNASYINVHRCDVAGREIVVRANLCRLRYGLCRPADDHGVPGCQILQTALRSIECRPCGDHRSIGAGKLDGCGRLLAGRPCHAQLDCVLIDVFSSILVRKCHGKQAWEKLIELIKLIRRYADQRVGIGALTVIDIHTLYLQVR